MAAVARRDDLDSIEIMAPVPLDLRHSRWVAWLAHAGALLLFGLFALTLAPQIALHPATKVTPDLIDPVFNVWAVASADHNAVTWSDGIWSFFHGNIYYPTPHAASYTDVFVGLLPLSLPMSLFLHNPVVLTNALVLLAFVLSSYGAFLLGHALTRRYSAGLVAGLIYGFSPLQIEQVGHLNVISTQWLVFGAYSLVRAWRSESWRWWAAAGALLGLAAVTSLYYLAYLSAPLLCVALLLWREWTPRRVRGVLLAVGVAVLLVVPFSVPYLTRQAIMNAHYGAAAPTDILSFVRVLSGRFIDQLVLPSVPMRMMQPDHGLFPGFVPLALAVIAWRCRRPWRWLLWSVACAVLALGPLLAIDGRVLALPLPYAWLGALTPRFAVFRDPVRAMSGAYLGLAVLAAWGVREVVERAPRRDSRAVMGAALVVLVALELWSPVPTVSVAAVPAGEQWLARQPSIHIVLELPMTSMTPLDWQRQTAIVYDSTAHWKTLVNGTGSVDPVGMTGRRMTLSSYPSPASITLIRHLHVDAVVLRLAWLAPMQRAKAEAVCRVAYRDAVEEICVGPWSSTHGHGAVDGVDQ